MKKFYLFLAIAAIAACKSAQNISYKLNLPAQDTFKYTHTQESDVDMKVMGMSQKTVNVQTMEMAATVKEKKANGDMVIETIIEQLKVDQVNPMSSVNFDSKNPENNSDDVANMYGAMVGAVLTSTMNPDGEVIAIEGTDALLDKMVANVADNPMMTKAQFKETLKAQFGDEAMSNTLGNIVKIYPNKPVKVGDSWMKTDTLSGTIDAIIETTYTLQSRKAGKSYIDVTGTIRPDKDGKGMEMMGMKMKYNLSGTQSGRIVLDEATGWADKSEIDQTMAGTVQMSGELIGTIDSEMDMKTRIVVEKQ